MNDNTQPSERDKLIALYRQKHEAESNYGPSTHHHRLTLDLMRKHDCQSLLDFGCGKGRLFKAIDKEDGLTAVGYDPAIDEFSKLRSDRYDMVTCLDVAEHWHPDSVDEELARISLRCSQLVFFIVSCRVAIHKLPDGQNCHTTVRSEDWWRAKISEHFTGWEVLRSAFNNNVRALTYILKA